MAANKDVPVVNSLEELKTLLDEYASRHLALIQLRSSYEEQRRKVIPPAFMKMLEEFDEENKPQLALASTNLTLLEEQIVESFKLLGNENNNQFVGNGWKVTWSQGRRSAAPVNVEKVAAMLKAQGKTEESELVSAIVTRGEPGASLKPNKEK